MRYESCAGVDVCWRSAWSRNRKPKSLVHVVFTHVCRLEEAGGGGCIHEGIVR